MVSPTNNMPGHQTPIESAAEPSGAQPNINPPSDGKPILHLCRSLGGITNTQLEPWATSFHELCEILLRPPPVGKKQGTYYIRGALSEGVFTRADANIARVDLVVLDGDSALDPVTGKVTEGAPPPLDVHIALIERGIPHVLYSTHSNGQPGKGCRYRVLIPVPGLAAKDLDAVIAWVIDGLHDAGCPLADVPENHRLSQPWFFPRVPDESAEYLCYADEDGEGLDAQEALDWYRTEALPNTDRLEEAGKVNDIHCAGSLFTQFNAEHGLAWMKATLIQNNYVEVGYGQINGHMAFRFLSPHSSSGQAGIILFKCRDQLWRVYSHHNANDPLTRAGGKVPTNDAWDLYRTFEHRGDQQTAITAWSQEQDNFPAVVSGSLEEHTISDIEKAPPLDPEGFPNKRYTASGKISLPTTVGNVRHLLAAYNIRALYNVIVKRTELRVPGLSGCPENASNSALTHAISLATLNGLADKHVPSCIATIADTTPYNPVIEYVTSRPWDGSDRLEALYGTLTLADGFPQMLMETLFRRWLLSAIAAAFKSNGFRSRGVLVLQGPQSIGKTAFFLSLVGDPVLREQLVLIDHHLDAGCKDSKLTAVGHWFVEIGELDSSFKKDVARLKGFLTDTVDKVRRPYAYLDSEYPRRTVFCASVNAENFLVDDTGNTRWWTIPVTAIDYEHGIDMQQLWAQVHQLYEAGEQWWLTPEEEKALEERNQQHRTVSAIRDILEVELDFDKPESDWRLMTATEVLLGIGIKNPTNPQARDCGNYLRDVLGPPTRSKGKTRWRVPLNPREFML